MRLAERREVVEKSGLCTYCLRHAAELECYAKGGLSKPRCTRPGCDGEHASGLHALMGEADAEVNLVAGDEGEAVGEYEHEHENEYEYQYECEYEGLWVGTLGATEVPKETNESADTTADQEPAQCDDQAKAGEEMNQYECEYEGLWVGTIGATEVPEKADKSAGITAGRGPAQDGDPVEMEEETAGDEQWDLETGQSDWRADGARDPPHEPSYRLPGDRARPPPPTETSQPRLKARLRAASDRQWEEARYNAWLRQLLSDDSSDEDEDEERYGRFAESGRWMTELYGIPQHPTATSGRECSA
jgi:hypothetical protein